MQTLGSTHPAAGHTAKPDTMRPCTSIKPSKHGMQDMCTGCVLAINSESGLMASASARTEAQCYHL